MKIDYTYDITSVDKEAHTMEIIYSSPDYDDIHVSARLPYKGESLEDIVRNYNPADFWLEQKTPVEDVAVGTKGEQEVEVRDYSPTPPTPEEQTKLDYESLMFTFRAAVYLKDAQLQTAMTQDTMYALDAYFIDLVQEISKTANAVQNNQVYTPTMPDLPQIIFKAIE